jgi:hypothetical protein
MIAQIIFEIFISWIGLGLAMFVLLDLGLNVAILCEKISDFLKSFTKYLRARFDQP